MDEVGSKALRFLHAPRVDHRVLAAQSIEARVFPIETRRVVEPVSRRRSKRRVNSSLVTDVCALYLLFTSKDFELLLK